MALASNTPSRSPSRPTLRRRALSAGAAAALAVGLASCGTSSGTTAGAAGTQTPAASVDPALAAKVPDEIKADGKIMVGTDSTYVPAEFVDGDDGTVGFDVDLFRAVAAKLGLTAEFRSAPFTDIVPGLAVGGQYEIGVSSFTITAARKNEALMVSYFQAGTQWATKAGNPAGVVIDDACGKRVAVLQATVQADDVAVRSKKCEAEKKPAVTIDPYPKQEQVTAALLAGKDDALVAESPVTGYAVQQSDGQLALLGDVYAAAPYGYAVRKDQQAFAEAVRDALAALIADGTYTRILEKWGVQGGAITEPAINP